MTRVIPALPRSRHDSSMKVTLDPCFEKENLMPTGVSIDPSLPVIEILRLYPQARSILARHGLDTCCGGTHPLRMAAAAHKIALEPILEEIERSIETAADHAGERTEARIDQPASPSSASVSSNPIAAEMSVREIMARWPRTALVFARHGLMGCGGAEGPDEPVGWFAKVHDVEVGRLLAELNDAAKGAKMPMSPAAPVAEPPVIFRPFLKAAFWFTFTGGTTLGVIALIAMALQGKLGTISGAIVQSHGHVQLYGWVALFIMGVAYHVLPRLKGVDLPGTLLPRLSLAAMAAGVIIRGAAQAAEAGSLSRVGYLIGGNLEIVAVLLFVSLTAPLIAAVPSREKFERWLTAGNLFFALATFVQVGAVGALMAFDTLTVPAFIETPFLGLFLIGFVGFWILGISARTLPVFMGLKDTSASGMTFSFIALTLGVPLFGLGEGLFIYSPTPVSRWLLAAGAVIGAAGMLAFPAALKIFRRPEPAGPGMESDRGFEKFIRASYAWLVVSALMLLTISLVQAISGEAVPHAYVGSFRHALTVGFITMMMVGMGSRILPIFSGVALRSAAARDVSYWLILVGCAIRVAFQALSEPLGPAFLKFSGVSGVLELTGIILFAWNVWPALNGARRKTRGDGARITTAGTGESERSASGQDKLPVLSTTSGIQIETPVLTRASVGRTDTPGSGAGADRDMPILPSTSAGALIDARPELLEIFVENGFVQMANPMLRSTVARFVTIERACAMHGVDLDRFLARLRAAAASRASESPTH